MTKREQIKETVEAVVCLACGAGAVYLLMHIGVALGYY